MFLGRQYSIRAPAAGALSLLVLRNHPSRPPFSTRARVRMHVLCAHTPCARANSLWHRKSLYTPISAHHCSSRSWCKARHRRAQMQPNANRTITASKPARSAAWRTGVNRLRRPEVLPARSPAAVVLGQLLIGIPPIACVQVADQTRSHICVTCEAVSDRLGFAVCQIANTHAAPIDLDLVPSANTSAQTRPCKWPAGTHRISAAPIFRRKCFHRSRPPDSWRMAISR